MSAQTPCHEGGTGTELIADVFTLVGDYIAIGQDMVLCRRQLILILKDTSIFTTFRCVIATFRSYFDRGERAKAKETFPYGVKMARMPLTQ